MHIQHVGYNPVGGSGTTIIECMRASEAYGHSTHCFAFTDPGSASPPPRECWTNVPIPDSILGRAYGRVSRSELRGFEPAIRRADIVFIHLLYREHCAWSARVAQENGIPIIVIPNGGLDPWVFSYRGLRKRIWLRMHREVLFGKTSTILFATETEAKKAGNLVRPSFEKVISWPAERFTSASVELVRNKGAAGRRKLLFVGRLHPMKRVLETIRALRRLDRTDWQLTIAGPPSTEIPVETLRKEAGQLWGDRILYVGTMPREQLGSLYAESDALLLFSHRENFGFVVAEAMCEALPVAISDGVDIHSIVTRSGSGLVKAIRTEDDITGALAEFLAVSPEKLTAMGMSAAKAGAEYFKFENFAARLNTLIVNCISRSKQES